MLEYVAKASLSKVINQDLFGGHWRAFCRSCVAHKLCFLSQPPDENKHVLGLLWSKVSADLAPACYSEPCFSFAGKKIQSFTKTCKQFSFPGRLPIGLQLCALGGVDSWGADLGEQV